MKNKIEQFASVERDFPGLLIQAQQYLLFRVDMSDMTPESLTKGKSCVSSVSLLQLFFRFPSLLTWAHRCCAGSWALKASKYIFIFPNRGEPPLRVLQPKEKSPLLAPGLLPAGRA